MHCKLLWVANGHHRAGAFRDGAAGGPKAGGWWRAAPCLALGLGCAWAWQQHLRLRQESRSSVTTPHLGRPEKYVTSVTCQACHPDQYASWHQSFHRTMTQVASPESVRGKFDNVALEFEGDVYHLEKSGDEF